MVVRMMAAPRGCRRARRAPAHWWCTRGAVGELGWQEYELEDGGSAIVWTLELERRGGCWCGKLVGSALAKGSAEQVWLSFAPIYFTSENDFDNVYGINMVQCGGIRRMSPQLSHKNICERKKKVKKKRVNCQSWPAARLRVRVRV